MSAADDAEGQPPCDSPFHQFYLDTKAAFPQGLPQGTVLPDFHCPTCSRTLKGRFVRTDAVQVYSTLRRKLVKIFDASEGYINETSNRIDPLGKVFISNPTCLRANSKQEVLCAVCFQKIAPAHESIIHQDNSKHCLAPLHAKCLQSSMKGFHRCPLCSKEVETESEMEVEKKLLMDEHIRSRVSSPRTAEEQKIDRVRFVGYKSRAQNHPKFTNIGSQTGPSRGRDPTCNICLEKILHSDLTWLHKDVQCRNAYHQDCLQAWIDASKTMKEDEFVLIEEDPKCPKCKGYFIRRPEREVELAIDDSDVETQFSRLPDNIQTEVLDRELPGYTGWELLVWTDRLL